jgi:hypothetical protein
MTFSLGTFCSWDVLRLGTFYLETFCRCSTGKIRNTGVYIVENTPAPAGGEYYERFCGKSRKETKEEM